MGTIDLCEKHRVQFYEKTCDVCQLQAALEAVFQFKPQMTIGGDEMVRVPADKWCELQNAAAWCLQIDWPEFDSSEGV